MEPTSHFLPFLLCVPAAVVVVGALIDEAARRSNTTHKQLAIAQGISPSVWTRQVQGVAGHHVSLGRIINCCPVAFVAELLSLLAQALGLELHQVFQLRRVA